MPHAVAQFEICGLDGAALVTYDADLSGGQLDADNLKHDDVVAPSRGACPSRTPVWPRRGTPKSCGRFVQRLWKNMDGGTRGGTATTVLGGIHEAGATR